MDSRVQVDFGPEGPQSLGLESLPPCQKVVKCGMFGVHVELNLKLREWEHVKVFHNRVKGRIFGTLDIHFENVDPVVAVFFHKRAKGSPLDSLVVHIVSVAHKVRLEQHSRTSACFYIELSC